MKNNLIAISLVSGIALCAPAFASSSAGSAASDSASSATSSASDSSKTSSKSSGKDDKVSAGDYQVMAVANQQERAGRFAVNLRALDTGRQVVVYMPEKVLRQAQLKAGDQLAVKDRVYGLELAIKGQAEPFMLIIEDAIHQELASRAILG